MIAPDHMVPFSAGELTGVPLPVVLRPATPMRDDELLAFSRRNRSYRIERNSKGELEIMTPVGGNGSRWEAFVIAELTIWTEQNGGVCFSSNGGFSLPDGSMLSPDASWISEGRWQALNDEQRSSFPPLCPEFVIEVLSASDSRPMLRAKMEAWLANGAQLAWMIDPQAGKLTIFRPGSGPEVLERPESIEGDGPVSGFRLRTARFWAR